MGEDRQNMGSSQVKEGEKERVRGKKREREKGKKRWLVFPTVGLCLLWTEEERATPYEDQTAKSVSFTSPTTGATIRLRKLLILTFPVVIITL